MVAGLRPWQLGFCVLLFEGVIGKEALENVRVPFPLLRRDNGSEVKHNRRFLWNPSYVITKRTLSLLKREDGTLMRQGMMEEKKYNELETGLV